jgi:starvation-inducible DNA-binding protein
MVWRVCQTITDVRAPRQGESVLKMTQKQPGHGRLVEPNDSMRAPALEICGDLRHLLADVFALYLKTKNFHWHMSGRHFRDYPLLLDEHAGQIFAMTDDIAERARKVGGTTLHSVSEISKYQRLKENNEESVGVREMLVELCADNRELASFLRSTHALCDRRNDVATAGLIENWIDQTEQRIWFLAEPTSEF